jgi:hypothetical protein
MSKTECQQANWSDIGLKDGSNGNAFEKFDTYVKSCAKADVIPDKTAYESGRNQGLKGFCTVTRGYGEGEAGSYYQKVCGNFNEADFLKGYKLGTELYQFTKAIEEAKNRVLEVDDKIKSAESSIKSLEAEISEGKLSYQERQAKLDLIGVKHREINSLNNRRYTLEDIVMAKKNEYESMKKTHLKMGFCSTEGCFTK